MLQRNILVAVGWLVLAVSARGEGGGTPLVHRPGVVTGADGKPLMGAVVRTLEANPVIREGEACPTTFAGLGKTYTTDAEGKYELTDLDPRLRYCVVISAAGSRVRVFDAVGPSEKKPLLTKLQATGEDPTPTDAVAGQVVDDDGHPVAGALIELFGETVKTPNGRADTLGVRDADPLAVTGEDGSFRLAAKAAPRTFFARVKAFGYAPQAIELSSGAPAAPDANTVRLNGGCSVAGRLVKDGQPVAGVKMMLAQFDRDSERFIGYFAAGSDEQGRFAFEHLPAGVEWEVMASMTSLGSRGATPAVRVKSGDAAGSTVDAGDVTVGPALTISGACVVAGGAALPKGMTVRVTPDRPFETARGAVSADGTFKVSGLNPGTVTVEVNGAKALRLSPDNASYWAHGAPMLMGSVAADTTLQIKLAPAADVPETDGGSFTTRDYEAAMARPLAGAAEK